MLSGVESLLMSQRVFLSDDEGVTLGRASIEACSLLIFPVTHIHHFDFIFIKMKSGGTSQCMILDFCRIR